jgi:hypothetical protein
MTRKTIAIGWGLVALALASSAIGQVRVRGYVRKDGTYVAPHYRSSPNSTKADNYSTRGNYNPYTGKAGRVPVNAGISYPATSYLVPEAPSVAPTHTPAGFQDVTVFRCIDSNGISHYIGYPRAGCDELLVRVPIQQSTLRPIPAPRFHGYGCTSDCSGHTAGYQWAERNGIHSPDDCSGRSQSFVEGCRAYAEEQAHSDNY